MTDAAWNAPHARTLGVILAGDAITERDERGGRVVDDTLLILLNAHEAAIPFTLPAKPGCAWELLFDTGGGSPAQGTPVTGGAYDLGARSLAALKLVPSAAHSV
jgi:glycogen operon protein